MRYERCMAESHRCAFSAALRWEDSEQLRSLLAHREVSCEERRLRVVQRLHDEVAQPLSAFGMAVQTLADSRSPEIAAELQSMVAEMLTVLRQVIDEMSPYLLRDLGLLAAIDWECRRFARGTGITCGTTRSAEDCPIDEGRALVVFRSFQDALASAAARRARTVHAECVVAGGALRVRVRDDGLPLTTVPLSWELVGMRERLLWHGGGLDLDWLPSQGFNFVTFSVPFCS